MDFLFTIHSLGSNSVKLENRRFSSYWQRSWTSESVMALMSSHEYMHILRKVSALCLCAVFSVFNLSPPSPLDRIHHNSSIPWPLGKTIGTFPLGNLFSFRPRRHSSLYSSFYNWLVQGQAVDCGKIVKS